MKRILKTEVPIDDQWHTVEAGTVGHVGQQYDDTTVCFWWSDDDVQVRTVRVFGTGHPIPDWTRWIGTVQSANGLVWHLVEADITTSTTTTEGYES